MREAAQIARVPEAQVRLDQLMEDLKVGRVTYCEYLVQLRNIPDEYRARQILSDQ
jgi:uncharacterized protein involved in exopolysaccharide biosynthesis